MKALIWNGPLHVELKDVEPPCIINETDAVIRVTLSSICGTDMHPYRGRIENFLEGTILGHEFTGVIEEIGSQVQKFNKGDRVVVSDIIACGECWYCRRNLHYHCKSASLFGYGQVVGEYTPGGQAEKVRVPYADVVMSKIPDGVKEEEILFIGDILSTGYGGVEEAGVNEKDTVVIIGGGPVGLMAAMAAKLKKPSAVYVIETNRLRHRVIKEIGCIPAFPQDVSQLLMHTELRGPDAVIEAVGTEETLQLALSLIRAKGTVVCLGSHHSKSMPLNTEEAFAKEMNLKFVVGNPIKYFDTLTQMVQEKKLQPERIISHELKLSEAVEGYKKFNNQEALKIILRP
ncbi:alcohol dehydrogenase catalytic domain-containing protein [Bacillus halotolerans]|uniref:alcohol dehydrogenase catalytic domain-containing protein n=1 Tax=Bacillus mojavensis subgroup TaxID=653388 RepID=UPI002DB5AE90|nr:alcohol dehydrogenase catalytic domain-containing protein [Bacillus mojavensis]MEC1686915.1 alcohol dehydrogenase catalytic domain-containing protein [Bacillus mojavensis]